MCEWVDDGDAGPAQRRWPMAPNDLLPRERWLWWEQLWADVSALRGRYHLAVRSGWWEDPVVVEALRAGGLGRALRLRRVGRPAGQARPALRPRTGRGAPSQRRAASLRPRPAGVRAVSDRGGLPAATRQRPAAHRRSRPAVGRRGARQLSQPAGAAPSAPRAERTSPWPAGAHARPHSPASLRS